MKLGMKLKKARKRPWSFIENQQNRGMQGLRMLLADSTFMGKV